VESPVIQGPTVDRSLVEDTVTRVTLVHSGLADVPLTSEQVKLGWVGTLHNLKSLLETGAVMPEVNARETEYGLDAG
jgi:hypothetical protein